VDCWARDTEPMPPTAAPPPALPPPPYGAFEDEAFMRLDDTAVNACNKAMMAFTILPGLLVAKVIIWGVRPDETAPDSPPLPRLPTRPTEEAPSTLALVRLPAELGGG
jgi:hypothetical protein